VLRFSGERHARGRKNLSDTVVAHFLEVHQHRYRAHSARKPGHLTLPPRPAVAGGLGLRGLIEQRDKTGFSGLHLKSAKQNVAHPELFKYFPACEIQR